MFGPNSLEIMQKQPELIIAAIKKADSPRMSTALSINSDPDLDESPPTLFEQLDHPGYPQVKIDLLKVADERMKLISNFKKEEPHFP